MGPNFILIGSMKSATSTIAAYLEKHPDVFMLPRSEPKFFSRDQNFEKGEAGYRALFEAAGDRKLVGEGTNEYSNTAYYPEVAERIAKFLPEMKIVFMARDPIERIRSDYVQRRSQAGDLVPPSIDAAVRKDPAWFIGQSSYWKNISAFREKFPDSQIFVGFMEDLSRNPDALFRGLTDFLGIDYIDHGREHKNSSKGKAVPSKAYSDLKKNGAVRLAAKLFPRSLKQAVVKKFFSGDEKNVAVDGKLRTFILNELGDDARQFLQFYGKPANYWKSISLDDAA